MKTITVKAPVNIAVIKYWGKKDENLIIPLNDSISGTLSMDHLCSTTTIALSDKFTSNRMWLNDEEVIINDNKRLIRCIDEVKKMIESKNLWPSNYYVHICSKNNFPTAAGLASSAAGYACLCFALCKLFEIDDHSVISSLARLGSGSACRSIYGGFVRWIAGHNHQTSIAKQIISENEWPEMRVLICVVNDQRKEVSSTNGMKTSKETSSLLKYRCQYIVDEHCQEITDAIMNKDFNKFAEITMKDSNQFHSICQDTYPPIKYLNETSWSIINLIHFINTNISNNTNIACYTFDAGPNACIYCLEQNVPIILKSISYLNHSKQQLEIKGIQYENLENFNIDQKIINFIDNYRTKYFNSDYDQTKLKYIISTCLGSGPKIITNHFNDFDCLLDESNGLPKTMNK